jgi:hypothetical protein
MYGLHNNPKTMEQIQALTKTLRELAHLVDEDVPMRQRSRRLNNTLAFAFELVESIEERPVRDSILIEPLNPCACIQENYEIAAI